MVHVAHSAWGGGGDTSPSWGTFARRVSESHEMAREKNGVARGFAAGPATTMAWSRLEFGGLSLAVLESSPWCSRLRDPLAL